MKRETGTGFVLRTWPLREADLIVSIFTEEHGKLRGVAHGATRPKSRWAGALDAMTEVAFEWRAREGDELASLSAPSIVQSPYLQARALEVTWTLALVAELVDITAPPHDADPTTYRLLRSSIDALLDGAPPPVIARYVQAWVLRLHGVLPDSADCVACGQGLRAIGATWHWSLHGLACPRCVPGAQGEAGVVVMPDDLAFLSSIRSLPPERVTDPGPRVLRRTGVLFAQLLRESLGRELRSVRFLDELERFE